MALPNFIVTGNLKEILGTVTGTELDETAMTRARVLFVCNFPAEYFLRFGGIGYRLEHIVEAMVNTDGDLVLDEDDTPVRLLANDDGLNVTGIQWQVRVELPSQALPPLQAVKMLAWWINAGEDGDSVDLVTTLPVPGLPVSPAPVLGGGGGDMLKAIYDPGNVNDDAFALENHTGTITSNEVSDFDAAVDARFVGGELEPVRLTADTETFTIAGGHVTQISGTTIDGVTAAVGDRVAVVGANATSGPGGTLTTQPANGIYVVTAVAANISLQRANDFDNRPPWGTNYMTREGGEWASWVSYYRGSGAYVEGTTPLGLDDFFQPGSGYVRNSNLPENVQDIVAAALVEGANVTIDYDDTAGTITISATVSGGGGGDFSSNTATSVDGEIVLFSGTTGKLGKRATGSGILKITSGVASVATAGTDYQAADADLTAIAALTSAANKLPYATGAGTWALTDLSAFGRTLIDDADATAALTTLGAEATANKNQANGYAGLDGSTKIPSSLLPSYVDDVVEAANFAALPGTGETGKIYVTLDNNKSWRWGGSSYVDITGAAMDPEITAIAGLVSAADRLPYYTGSGTAALATFTSAARDLLDDADASTMRNTLGLGSAAVEAAATAATANTVAKRGATGSITAVSLFSSFTSTATAASTTTLSISSAPIQYFTGTTTQTVTLPTTSLPQGAQYLIVNLSTGAVTVQSSGGNTVIILAPGTSALLTALVATPTTAGNWDARYRGASAASGKSLTANNTMTLAGTDGNTYTFPAASGTVLTADSTATQTNKRITKRVTQLTSNSATPTWNSDNCDALEITGQTTPITNMSTNHTGTPTNFQPLTVAITATATIAIAWGTLFENGPAALPTTTSGTQRLDAQFEWNAVTSKFRCMAWGSA